MTGLAGKMGQTSDKQTRAANGILGKRSIFQRDSPEGNVRERTTYRSRREKESASHARTHVRR